METLDEFPESLDYDLYGPLFERARIANFNKNERIMFDLEKLAEEKRQAEIESGISFGEEKGKSWDNRRNRTSQEVICKKFTSKRAVFK